MEMRLGGVLLGRCRWLRKFKLRDPERTALCPNHSKSLQIIPNPHTIWRKSSKSSSTLIKSLQIKLCIYIYMYICIYYIILYLFNPALGRPPVQINDPSRMAWIRMKSRRLASSWRFTVLTTVASLRMPRRRNWYQFLASYSCRNIINITKSLENMEHIQQ